MVVRMPASANPEVFAAQKTMVEAWSIVGESFVDGNFNGRDFEDLLRSHMAAAYAADSASVAYGEIDSMLAELGDPYTRIVPPQEYSTFRVSADGELQGVGLLIANEPVNNHLMVLAPIRGGPADRAGMKPGDEVLSINDECTDGWTGDQAAKLLRGRGGTDVKVKFVRYTNGIPGIAGRPEQLPTPQFREVLLKRETVSMTPLFYTAFQQGKDTVGYLRLASFSGNAAEDMRKAIMDLERRGANSYILDLRNNPGGMVRSGIDIARLWLDGQPTVLNITGRSGMPMQRVSLDGPGMALTHDPLVVLVDAHSASASEILSGALHDNGRAQLVGDSPTYGKGRIQSVLELEDGSGLFITVAKYTTPNGTEIDLKGLRPDRSCALGQLSGVRGMAGADGGGGAPFQPGLPVGLGSEAALQAELQEDSCVLTAEGMLRSYGGAVARSAPVHRRL